MPIEAGGALENTLLTFVLVLCRVGGVFVFVPIPGMRQGPEAARVVLSVSIALALYPAWPRLQWDPTMGEVLGAIIVEALFGLMVGILVGYLTEMFALGAQILSLQAGYSYASTVDPNTQAESGVLSIAAQLFSGLLFFSLGLHLHVLRIFAATLETCPPGSFRLTHSLGDQLIRFGGEMLSTGLRLALPVIVTLAVIDITLALVGRLNGQLQLLALAFPAKMLISLCALSWLIVTWPKIYSSTATRILNAVESNIQGFRP